MCASSAASLAVGFAAWTFAEFAGEALPVNTALQGRPVLATGQPSRNALATDMKDRPPDQISRMGVARTFQRNNLFQNLSVIENLRLALEVRYGKPLDFFRPADRNAVLMARAKELMAEVHLGPDGGRTVRNLSYGEQRQLEIAIALAGSPKILLLDEPTSGMSPAETARMIELIAGLPKTLAILMIEHDMKVVFSVADRVTVLYYGKILATGTPDEIQANARVREVYLGMRH